jgi:hypothetical protein
MKRRMLYSVIHRRLWALGLGGALLAGTLCGQTAEPYRGIFTCRDAQMTLHIDAYAETVPIPGMAILGPSYGYLSGRGVSGLWLITSCHFDDDGVRLRLSNDQGADNQTLHVKSVGDSMLEYKVIGTNVLRKVVRGKWVKTDSNLLFQRTP